MRKLPYVLATVVIGLVISGATRTADAADAVIPREAGMTPLPVNCQDLWRCGPNGCAWRRVCTRPCPDGYSCAPLYGAYGPYGGVGYWGGYTDSGWGYR
jgi:hypothetical protein